MKKQITLLTILSLFIAAQTFGQVPQAFKYQAIARDNSGNIIANTKVSFRMSILQGSISGSVSYEETDTATTNQFGLANLSIGMGTLVSGNMTSINWGSSTYYIKVEFDPAGGSNFTLMGTSQMLSVPYALYAATGGTSYSAGAGIAINSNTITNTEPNQTVTLTGAGTTSVSGTYPNFTVNSWDTTMWKKNGTNIYYNVIQPVNGGVGIGTKNPANLLHLQDTVGIGGISAIIEGRVLTGVYLRTHDTLNAPYKSWVMQNETFSGTPDQGNTFSLFNNGNYPFIVQANSPTHSLIITTTGVAFGEYSGPHSASAKLEVNGSGIYTGGNSNGWLTGASIGINELNVRYWRVGAGITVSGSFSVQNNPGADALTINGTTANVGINNSNPQSRLQVTGGDVYVDNSANGVIMKSPNGNCWRIQINNSGTITAT